MEVASQNSRGFTLIEALIAILILSIMLLGLIPAFMKAYNVNQEVTLRDVAMDVAHEKLEQMRSEGMSNLSSNSTIVNRRVKKASIPFSVNTTVTSLYGGDMRAVTVKVYWTYRGEQRSYNATTIIGEIDD